MQKSKIIIKQKYDHDIKQWRIECFWLDMSANFGCICCNEIVSENTIISGNEASLEYFHSCKKATKEQIDIALKALKKCYGGDFEVRNKLSKKDLNLIWSEVKTQKEESVLLSNLQGEGYFFSDQKEHIQFYTELLGIDESITGIVLLTDELENGEIKTYWVTNSARPFDLACGYSKRSV